MLPLRGQVSGGPETTEGSEGRSWVCVGGGRGESAQHHPREP